MNITAEQFLRENPIPQTYCKDCGVPTQSEYYTKGCFDVKTGLLVKRPTLRLADVCPKHTDHSW